MRCAESIKVALAGLVFGIIVVVAALAVAWPARADADTDFANQLHGYGIYIQGDYKSAEFVTANLQRGSTASVLQFLGAAIDT
jgi:hypothetical protein